MKRWPAQIALALVHAYRFTLSPAFAAMGVRCRHEPSCSAYALEAVRRHGAWFGLWMAGARFLRCRPGGSSGYDPAPKCVCGASAWTPWRAADWRGPRNGSHKRPCDTLGSSAESDHA